MVWAGGDGDGGSVSRATRRAFSRVEGGADVTPQHGRSGLVVGEFQHGCCCC